MPQKNQHSFVGYARSYPSVAKKNTFQVHSAFSLFFMFLGCFCFVQSRVGIPFYAEEQCRAFTYCSLTEFQSSFYLCINAVKAIISELWMKSNQIDFHHKQLSWSERFEASRLKTSSL